MVQPVRTSGLEAPRWPQSTEKPHRQRIKILFFNFNFLRKCNLSAEQQTTQSKYFYFNDSRLFLAAESSDQSALEVAWRAMVTLVQETWDFFWSRRKQLKHLCCFSSHSLCLFVKKERRSSSFCAADWPCSGFTLTSNICTDGCPPLPNNSISRERIINREIMK